MNKADLIYELSKKGILTEKQAADIVEMKPKRLSFFKVGKELKQRAD